MATGARIQGWTAEQWVTFLRRNPDASLLGGVGGMLIAAFARQCCERDNDFDGNCDIHLRRGVYRQEFIADHNNA